MADDVVITINAGSSSVKFGVYCREAAGARRIGKAVVDLKQRPMVLQIDTVGKLSEFELGADMTNDPRDFVGKTIELLSTHFSISSIAAIGHRMVHGGDIFPRAALIDEDVDLAIEGLVPLAPLHQPQALRVVRAVRHMYPTMMQTVSFDTSFHLTNDDLVRRLALPRALHASGIKRYGFHGLSYAFIARQLTKVAPTVARLKVVVAHLGNGCSLCGLDDGLSRDTSMGFSTLDGVPMATRCGALDPGVLLHLLLERGHTAAALQDLLYNRSGLLGVSGISGDTRELITNLDPHAKEAIDLFALRVAGEAARIASTLGGLDAFVFTGGIGEHQPEIRQAISARLAWLGLAIDMEENAAGHKIISSSTSNIKVLVVPTDEEQVIADDAFELLRLSK